MPIPLEKIQQYVVQFACRIPAKRELTRGEKNTLENLLRDVDHEHFQLPQTEPTQDPALLFQVLHQNTVGQSASVITSPTFTFFRDNFSFYYPLIMMNHYIIGRNSLETRPMNRDIASLSNKVLDAVNGSCLRAGKIYIMVLGPFQPDEKATIFQNVCSGNLNLAEIGEFNLSFANYRRETTGVYNILTSINLQVNDLNDPFYVNVRIDINNRILQRAMEPPDMERVWNYADGMIAQHIDTLLNIR